MLFNRQDPVATMATRAISRRYPSCEPDDRLNPEDSDQSNAGGDCCARQPDGQQPASVRSVSCIATSTPSCTSSSMSAESDPNRQVNSPRGQKRPNQVAYGDHQVAVIQTSARRPSTSTRLNEPGVSGVPRESSSPTGIPGKTCIGLSATSNENNRNLSVGSFTDDEQNRDRDDEEEDANFDYEPVLTKILNEKKLALSYSPDVVKFLSNNRPTLQDLQHQQQHLHT